MHSMRETRRMQPCAKMRWTSKTLCEWHSTDGIGNFRRGCAMGQKVEVSAVKVYFAYFDLGDAGK